MASRVQKTLTGWAPYALENPGMRMFKAVVVSWKVEFASTSVELNHPWGFAVEIPAAKKPSIAQVLT